MPRISCLVPTCHSRAPFCKLYTLPRTSAIRALWMKYLLPIVPGLRSLTANQLIYNKICGRHFEAKYIQDNKRINNGVPTLFTEEEIKSGIPANPLPSKDAEKIYNEHSYCYMRRHLDHNYCNLHQDSTDVVNTPDEEAADTDWPSDADEPTDDLHVPLPDLSSMDNFIKRPDEFTRSCEPLINRSDGILGFNKAIFKPRAKFTTSRPHKFNQIQQYMDEFIKEIQEDITCLPPDNEVAKGNFADELETYNFSAEVIMTNKEVTPYDSMEHLMYSEKAYAAITYCLLKQQDLFKESIRDFLAWAGNAELDFACLEEKVADIFENGKFIKISFKILEIICKYRVKNIEIRKDGIVNQALDPSMKESLRTIRHTSTQLFDEEALKSALNTGNSTHRLFVLKKNKAKLDKGVQVNILPKKSDKNVQVKPKKVRKARKAVQVNCNELEIITTGKKVRKKEIGSQTSDKDILLGATMLLHDNSLLRKISGTNDNPINHCQKVQYVVNIKRKPLRPNEIKKQHINPDSLAPNSQAGPESISSRSQHLLSNNNSNIETSDNHGSHHEPKKRKTAKSVSDPSMPLLLDACQNHLSLGCGSNINETESETVHSTLERKSRTYKRHPHPNFGKKRRPKIPEKLNEPISPMKSSGTSPMRGSLSEDLHLPAKSMNTLHVCDSPYLLGGCKHSYDPQSESVPTTIHHSSIHRDQSTQRGANQGSNRAKRRRYNPSEPSRSMYDSEVPRNSDFYEGSPVVVYTQNQSARDSNPESSHMLLLTYDNLLSRWT